MARIRYLKPDFFKDEDLAKLPYETRLFFAGLWGQADKAGRLQDRSERLKVEIFPYDAVDVEKCLQQLSLNKATSGQPFINRYSVNGQKYIQILNWYHQKPHHTEKESTIPPYPLMEMEKGMGMENQLEASTELRNGEGTVKEPLNGKEKDAPPVLSLSEQIKKDRSFAKCCYLCGRSSPLDSGRFVWRDRRPFCELRHYTEWVTKGKPEPA
ncbi:MAG: hypothetical protein MUP81_03190 [Dehalococcoidia bacterium]|nr:hypothetical protein [Dehalococcoidia bacterium]